MYEATIYEQESGEFMPRYDLTPEEMQQGERGLVEQVQEAYGEAVAAVWINTKSPFANVVRTHELEKFPEIAEVMEPYEAESRFLALVDTRNSEDRIVHAFRVSSPSLTPKNPESENEVNIAFVQDLVASGQFTEAEFVEFYKGKGIDLDKCVSVETNFRVGEKVEPVNSIPLTLLGYLSLFTEVAKNVETDEALVFAHLNRPATISLGMVNIQYEPVMDNPELKTPTTDHGFDPKYNPVAVLGNAHNMELFKMLAAGAPPKLEL